MRILIAEDDAVSRLILEKTLSRWGHEVVVTEDGAAAWAALQAPEAPRLVILDWMMPGVDGMEVCRRLRNSEPKRFTYVVILTARTRKEDIVVALDAGADDYLTKPYDAEELRARVGAGVRIVRLQEQLEAVNKQLQESAQRDYLTGLLNRRALMDRFEEELNRMAREQRAIAVLLGDLDHFKQINDTFGHTMGDRALVQVAERLNATCRPYDILGRYGGEEFFIALPHTSLDVTRAVAERVRTAVAAAPVEAEDYELDLSISVGASWVEPCANIPPQAIIAHADTLLYRAKANGRNQCVLEAFAPDA